MMKSNFHTHTYRCNHAGGLDREYVEVAIRNGLSVLGFADHSPYWFPHGYYSTHRMHTDEVEDYVNSVLSLKEEYKNDIQIYLGFEAEYYPLYFDELLANLSQYPYDYLILGQHFIKNEIGKIYMMDPCSDYETLSKYVDECIAGMVTEKFFYLAHPDLINFKGSDMVYQSEMRRLCEAAKRLNVPLELNLLGLRDKRDYPRMDFWKIAGEVGNEVLFGCDSHTPDTVGLTRDYIMGSAIVEKFGLNFIEPMSPYYRK
ncbi:MAG: histidinol-phosphatase [Clostridia bacterium]|nr:histidinol-phosphatase [Clostridia bacterium]